MDESFEMEDFALFVDMFKSEAGNDLVPTIGEEQLCEMNDEESQSSTISSTQSVMPLDSSIALPTGNQPSTVLNPNVCPITMEFNALPAPAVLGASWLRLRGYGTDDEDEDDDDDEDGLGGLGKATKAKPKDKKRKKRPNQPKHPDLERIAIATMENLKSMNIDPNSKEGMKIKRRIRNRMSAQLHRERKKAYIGYLEGLVRENEKNVQNLTKSLEKLFEDYNSLRQSLYNIIDIAGSVDHRVAQLLAKYPAYVAVPPEKPSVAAACEDCTSVSNSTPSHNPSDSEQSVMGLNSSESAFNSIKAPFDEYDFDDDEDSWESAPKKQKSFSGASLSLFSVAFFVAFSLFGQNSLLSSLFPMLSSSSILPKPTISVLESQDSLVSSWAENAELPVITNRLIVVENDRDDNDTKLVIEHRLADSRAELSGGYPIVTSSAHSALSSSSVPPENRLLQSHSSIDSGRRHYVVSPEHALWKYQDMHPMALYPISRVSPIRPIAERSVIRKRRYLRSNNLHPDNESTEGIQHDFYDPRVRTAYNYGLPRLPTPDAEPGASTAVMSQVVMTNGRALLDVGLAGNLLSAPSAQQHSKQTSSDEGTSKALSTWISTSSSTASASSLRAGSVVSSSSSSGNLPLSPVVPITMAIPSAASAGSEGGELVKDPNMLLMLMPASSVRWGKSWGDSTSMAALMNNLGIDGRVHVDNSSDASSTTEGSAHGTDQSEESNMWIEIGCQVFKAQLVKNVSFN